MRNPSGISQKRSVKAFGRLSCYIRAQLIQQFVNQLRGSGNIFYIINISKAAVSYMMIYNQPQGRV